MKNVRWFSLSVLFLPIVASLAFGLEEKWKGNTLSVREAQTRWGHDPFEEKKFQSGNSTARAKMTASILKEKPFLNQPISEVERTLGHPDGYFGSEQVPAYLVEDGRRTGKPSWQLVFYPSETGKVSDIFIQENGSELSHRRKILNKSK